MNAHKKVINSMQFSKDHSMFITASSDMVARVYDTKSLQLLKTFVSDRPLNAAAFSPILNHIILGGGQDAGDVTTTDSRVGKFEVDFCHLVRASDPAPLRLIVVCCSGVHGQARRRQGSLRSRQYARLCPRWQEVRGRTQRPSPPRPPECALCRAASRPAVRMATCVCTTWTRRPSTRPSTIERCGNLGHSAARLDRARAGLAADLGLSWCGPGLGMCRSLPIGTRMTLTVDVLR